MFWSIKNAGEVLSKLKSRGFYATSLSTYDFSTLYTTLPHNLIKEQLIDSTEGALYFVCNNKRTFFTSTDHRRFKHWSCQNVCYTLSFLLDNKFTLDVVLSYTDKLLVFRWVQIVLLS